MIVEEIVDKGTRVRHYSDRQLKIRQVETGIVYEDAVDVLPCRYTYEETDEPIITVGPEDNERGFGADRLIAGDWTWDDVPAQRKPAVDAILHEYVSEGKITEDQYKEITGNEY